MSPDGCLIHQSTLFLGKHHYAISILYIGRSADISGHCRSLRIKLKFILFEAIQGSLVFKKYYFAISLSAKLKTHTHLFHTCPAHRFFVFIQNSISGCTTYSNSSFAHIREYYIPCRTFK